ncbi:DUF4935 domain-containing protein [Bacillus thuringiensis]|uniref:PIN-like domain-containing protein n=1 Tax=Bacillus thuringiensis TaxID=1428 RepID=UPI0005A33CD1|nr:PIN-like domain-containing protein [Bacillus thuringiensis]AJH81773.1 hypothetical protein BF36_1345 [Bacillus thuringiensis]QKI17588.1 DUF4935 domain-containing protein [Bacillus thuringiensis]
MKLVFPEFYKRNEEECKEIFKDCYFIIDTNVLLNLYRYSESTRNELLGLLEKIKDQLWMPYQVGLEFHFNRVPVILEQKMAYENICKKIDSQANDFITNLKKGFNNRHPKIQMDSIAKQIRSSFDSLIKDLKKHEEEHPNLLNNDNILAELNQMYEGKVSEPYSKTDLEKIYEEGEKRYQKNFPPGYEDEKTKKDRTKEYDDIIYKDKFGDLVVWKQIIDKAKEEQKTIVFVTDDVKEDWWEIKKGRTIGPRIELLNEFKKEANVDFYMYKTDSFMRYIKEYLQEQVNKEVIKEMEDLRESNLYNERIYIGEYNDSDDYAAYLSMYDESDDHAAYLRMYEDSNEYIYPDGSIEKQRELATAEIIEEREYFLGEIQKLNSKIDRTFERIAPTLAEWNIHDYQNIKRDYYRRSIKFKGRENSLNELQEHHMYLREIYKVLKKLYTDSILKSQNLI